MLKLNKLEFYGADNSPQPQRKLEMDAEIEQLWPKIMALNTGELLVVPYDSSGKMWAGYAYCRKLRKIIASHPSVKFCNLRVTRSNSRIYIMAVRNIWQPVEESRTAGLAALCYFGFLSAALMHWTTVEWIVGTLFVGCCIGIAERYIKILKDHIQRIERRVEDLEQRVKECP
jgi:hypothetical protein